MLDLRHWSGDQLWQLRHVNRLHLRAVSRDDKGRWKLEAVAESQEFGLLSLTELALVEGLG